MGQYAMEMENEKQSAFHFCEETAAMCGHAAGHLVEGFIILPEDPNTSPIESVPGPRLVHGSLGLPGPGGARPPPLGVRCQPCPIMSSALSCQKTDSHVLLVFCNRPTPLYLCRQARGLLSTEATLLLELQRYNGFFCLHCRHKQGQQKGYSVSSDVGSSKNNRTEQ